MCRNFEAMIKTYEKYLNHQEKSPATVEKYLRDVRAFFDFLHNETVDKEDVIAYKQHLIEAQYAVNSINSMLASVNSFLCFNGKADASVKGLKVQQKIYSDAQKELTRPEYEHLVRTAENMGKIRLSLAMQTFASTGIRISELTYFTVESITWGEIAVSCKNKNRRILIPKALKKKLLDYADKQGIYKGIIFRTKTGKALSRKNIWEELKALAKQAGVNSEKVYPHNFRKLFAREFHKGEKDIAKLADVLGHSSINTTRIYVIGTGKEHQRRIDSMKLII